MKTLKIIAVNLLLLLAASNTVMASEDELLVVAPADLNQYWTVTKRKAPTYPRTQLRQGIEGCVTLGFIIEANGKVSSPKVIAAEPGRVFAAAAIKAIKRWRFEPSGSNASATPVYTTQTLNFDVAGNGSDSRLESVQTCGSA